MNNPRKILIIILLISLICLLLFNCFKNETLNDKNPKLLICGCARNFEKKNISKVLNNLNKLAKKKDVFYIFYENDSKDKTLKILQDFINKNDGIVISEKDINIKRRTPRIAYCRNKILDYIYQNNLNKVYDFYINVDLDDVNKKIDINSVNRCLSESNKWDIASINQHHYYYDLWALRTINKNNNCSLNNNCHSKINKWFPKLKNESKISSKEDYLPVLSAFGGFTIYKTYLLSNCYYSGESYENKEKDDCEHVNFHKCILKKNPNTRFYIIPYMKNYGI